MVRGKKKIPEPVYIAGPILFIDVDDTLIDWECIPRKYWYHMDQAIPNRHVLALANAWIECEMQVIVWSSAGQDWAEEAIKQFFPRQGGRVTGLDKRVNLHKIAKRFHQGDVFIDDQPEKEYAAWSIHPYSLGPRTWGKYRLFLPLV